MIAWFMDRYRGRNGLFGWFVYRADLRWLGRIHRTAREVAR